MPLEQFRENFSRQYQYKKELNNQKEKALV